MTPSIEIILPFDLKNKNPLDSRTRVADSTARLALTWYYKGMIVRQDDNSNFYLYFGDETTNVSGDWLLIQGLISGTGAPAGSLGVIGNIYIAEDTKTFYKKTGASTWTALFTATGASFFTSSGVPSNGTGLDGDFNFSDNGFLYKKIAGVWVSQFTLKGTNGTNGTSDKYATTSVTSINLATAAAPLSLTVGVGLSYTVGQEVIVASLASNANNVTGAVVSYDNVTGILILNGLTIAGTGTHTDWQVNLTGAPGVAGTPGVAFKHTEHDITLTQAKITAIVGGSYTPVNPWSASVLNDTRSPSELTSTVNLEGSQAGNSIFYDGTNWTNNGQWRGPAGADGLNIVTNTVTNTVTNNNNYPYTRVFPVPSIISNLAYGRYSYSVVSGNSHALGGGNVPGTVIHLYCLSPNNTGTISPDAGCYIDGLLPASYVGGIAHSLGSIDSGRRLHAVTLLAVTANQWITVSTFYNEIKTANPRYAILPNQGLYLLELATFLPSSVPSLDLISYDTYGKIYSGSYQQTLIYEDLEKVHKLEGSFSAKKDAGNQVILCCFFREVNGDGVFHNLGILGAFLIESELKQFSFGAVDANLTIGNSYRYRIAVWSYNATGTGSPAPSTFYVSGGCNIGIHQIPK